MVDEKVSQRLEIEPRQLALFDAAAGLAEARRYHGGAVDDPDFPYLAWTWRTAGDVAMRQKAVPVARLTWLIEQIATRPDWQREHHFVVQNEFCAPNRRALNLWSFGLLWADLDLCSASHDARTVDHWTCKALRDCADLGIPEPSISVWSGRGLHLKWVLDARLPAEALPRWSAVMREIFSKLASAGWPVDSGARDVSRVLRIAGTMNPKPDDHGNFIPRRVYVTHDGPVYDFELLCEWLLPYRRDQVEQFRRDDQARAEADQARRRAWQQAGQQYAEFDENRRRAAAAMGKVLSSAAAAADEAGQSLHWTRLDAIRRAAQARGGIAQGQRNEWIWIAANSLAWGLGDAGRLWLELPQLVQEIAPTLTVLEARSSASSVYRRLKAGGRDSLYRIKTATLIDRLGLTQEEARGLRGGGHGTNNPGALNLPKLEGMSYDDWTREVHRRFALGAKHASSVRDEVALSGARRMAQKASVKARTQASEDRRAQALQMRARGLSLERVAEALGVSLNTAWRWCR